jgi:hypothetical protein
MFVAVSVERAANECNGQNVAHAAALEECRSSWVTKMPCD